jgi:hypothetical protein
MLVELVRIACSYFVYISTCLDLVSQRERHAFLGRYFQVGEKDLLLVEEHANKRAGWVVVNSNILSTIGRASGQPSGGPSGQPTGETSGQPLGEPSGEPTGQPIGRSHLDSPLESRHVTNFPVSRVVS